jgi:hypothetical protein
MADKSVFSRLRRLFSTDVVIRNVGGKQVKTIDSGHIQSSGEYETNALVDRFNKVYSSAPTSLLGAQFNLNYQYLRTTLYSEYDVMDIFSPGFFRQVLFARFFSPVFFRPQILPPGRPPHK